MLNPLNPSTYSAIGFIHALIGNTQEAVDAFHKALGLRRDDTFTTTMLGYVMEQLIDEDPPFAGSYSIKILNYNAVWKYGPPNVVTVEIETALWFQFFILNATWNGNYFRIFILLFQWSGLLNFLAFFFWPDKVKKIQHFIRTKAEVILCFILQLRCRNLVQAAIN